MSGHRLQIVNAGTGMPALVKLISDIFRQIVLSVPAAPR